MEVCRSSSNRRAKPNHPTKRSKESSASPASRKKRRMEKADAGSAGEVVVVDGVRKRRRRSRFLISPLGDSRWMTHREQSHYYKTVRESEGFDVPHLPGVLFFGMIYPVRRDEKVEEYTKSAISFYNSQEGTDLQLVKVVKANRCISYPGHHYITFKASDGEGHVRTYETMVSNIPGKPTGRIRVGKFRVKRRSKLSSA
ncbi:hypothetical protein MLD38_037776 [Melastoma candidum]|uniref:Uncharacterized protein n=1 Tax=Melastoma candidum TaxID=119954 RepID=A0ACB9LQE3_9MYRT|nr:hypothetical protein MLD38_037776 [Melastoma candidum]